MGRSCVYSGWWLWDTVCALCNVQLLTSDLTLHAHHAYCRNNSALLCIQPVMNEPAGGALYQTDMSAVRIRSHQLTISQTIQNNKKWLSIFICPFASAEASFSQRYSNRPLSHASHVRTDNADDQCVLMLSSPLSVSNRPTLWLTAHYLHPNTNNTLQWRVTFRNLNAWLLPVPRVSQSYCNMLQMSISAWFLLVVGQCLFHCFWGRSDTWITSSLHSFKSCSNVRVIFSRWIGSCSFSCLCASVWIKALKSHFKISEHQCVRY